MPLSVARLRADLAHLAQRELDGLRRGGGDSLDERERRARVIASLTRSLARVDASRLAAAREHALKAEMRRRRREGPTPLQEAIALAQGEVVDTLRQMRRSKAPPSPPGGGRGLG